MVIDNDFYINMLYPLQDKILTLITSLKTGFYLTGGTALSRNYLFHRFSDDIDLFVNNDSAFEEKVIQIEKSFKANNYPLEVAVKSETFARLLVSTTDCILKIDLVNDLVPHFGEVIYSMILGNVDNVYNILSNKISALPRQEIKDFADIAFIARKYQFNWRQVIGEASEKDSWVNPIDVSRYFATTDTKLLALINWIEPANYNLLAKDLSIISDDILRGKDNSLFQS